MTWIEFVVFRDREIKNGDDAITYYFFLWKRIMEEMLTLFHRLSFVCEERINLSCQAHPLIIRENKKPIYSTLTNTRLTRHSIRHLQTNAFDRCVNAFATMKNHRTWSSSRLNYVVRNHSTPNSTRQIRTKKPTHSIKPKLFEPHRTHALIQSGGFAYRSTCLLMSYEMMKCHQ